MTITTGERVLSVKEKVGYGLGDTASNIVFQVVVNFMMIFYTDVFGISAAAAGTMMLILRLFDGVTDPIMGAIADRTSSAWGRYRPYLLWAAIPYGILAVLAFSTPDLSTSQKLVYAYITYALLMVVYTIINIPYAALGGVITQNPKERASLQSYRFALAMVGGAIVTALTLPLVSIFGGDDKQQGYQYTMIILASVAVLCFWLCFYLTRERVENNNEKQEQSNINFLPDCLALIRNSQWLILAAIAFLMLVLVAMRGAATPYYMTYYMGREDLVALFFTLAMVSGVAGALLTNYLSKFYCKVALFKVGCLGIIIFHAVLFYVPKGAVLLAFIVFMLANFSQLIVVPLMFSMVPDAVDYGFTRGGRKSMGLAFSMHLLAIKLGLAVGSAITGWLLGFYGYVPNQDQSESALLGIKLVFSASAVVCGVGVMALIFYYRLTNKAMLGIKDEKYTETNQSVPDAVGSL